VTAHTEQRFRIAPTASIPWPYFCTSSDGQRILLSGRRVRPNDEMQRTSHGENGGSPLISVFCGQAASIANRADGNGM
jgi:hypothetical protein